MVWKMPEGNLVICCICKYLFYCFLNLFCLDVTRRCSSTTAVATCVYCLPRQLREELQAATPVVQLELFNNT